MDVEQVGGWGADGTSQLQGEWLVAHRRQMERGEASWLTALADFDRDQGWAVDGALSTVAWLMWRTDMARATAFEKVRIARELRRRPIVAAAFEEGRLSYSAVRIITRIEGPTSEVDAALVDLAEAGSIADVERATRVYQRYADQERPPPSPEQHRGLRMAANGDGTTSVTVILTDLEAAELTAALQAFLDLRAGTPDASATPGCLQGAPEELQRQSLAGDNACTDPPAGTNRPVSTDSAACTEESPTGDRWVAGGAVDWAARRADAVVEMARTALAHAGAGHAMGADRYLVHVVLQGGHRELVDGTPIDAATAEQVACDAGVVLHLDEPLQLGRKTRTWSTAQRRAILVRDGGRCRFPGCDHAVTDIHHLRPWSEGGPTDVGNGLLVCPGHHRVLHHGVTASGDTGGEVTFRREDRSVLGSSRPRDRRRPLLTSGPANP